MVDDELVYRPTPSPLLPCATNNLLPFAFNDELMHLLFLFLDGWLSVTSQTIFPLTVVMAAFRSPHAKTNPAMVEQALRAVVNLAFNNATNQTELGELGVCVGICRHCRID